jgi:MerR family transcriptional regulator, light-induced transcriptional regulator
MGETNMAAFVEQVADPTGWTDTTTAHLLRAPSLAPRERSADHAAIKRADLARERHTALLNRVVQTEILPRLVLAKLANASLHAAIEATPAATADETTELTHLLLSQDAAAVIEFIELLHLRGAPPESLYLGVMTDAARRLDDLWAADRCDFAQVTIGMGLLQQALRALSQSFLAAAVGVNQADARSVLLLPAPGEQHTFGLLMLGEFFRRSGWHVAGGPVSSDVDAADMVRSAWFDVAAFSVGSEALLDGLARCVRRVRRESRNSDLGILVGGPLFQRRPDLVARVGADATAGDAPGAVQQASALLAMPAAAE